MLGGIDMSGGEQQLDVAIRRMIDEQIKTTECIHGWEQVPTGDIIVFLSDKERERATRPVAQKVGSPLGRGRTLVFACPGGEWVLVGAGFWGGGVGRLLQYFQAMASADPNPQWRAGIELCKRWALLQSSQLTQTTISDFIARLDAEHNPGSVWLDFREQFIHWAWNRGFKVEESSGPV